MTDTYFVSRNDWHFFYFLARIYLNLGKTDNNNADNWQQLEVPECRYSSEEFASARLNTNPRRVLLIKNLNKDEDPAKLKSFTKYFK